MFHVQMKSHFSTWPDKIFYKIHSPTRPHPAEVRIWILRFDDNVLTKEYMAVESEVAKGTEPRGWIYQLISDDKRHRVFFSSSVAANFGTSVHNLTNIASKGAATFAFYPRVALSCVFF